MPLMSWKAYLAPDKLCLTAVKDERQHLAGRRRHGRIPGRTHERIGTDTGLRRGGECVSRKGLLYIICGRRVFGLLTNCLSFMTSAFHVCAMTFRCIAGLSNCGVKILFVVVISVDDFFL